MDRELAGMLRAEYAKRGIKFMLSAKVVSVMPDTAEASSLIQVNYETADGPGSVVAERLLMSVGRRPVMKGFGLENLGLERTERGNVFVNGQMQTSVPGVYACGDLGAERHDPHGSGAGLGDAYARPRADGDARPGSRPDAGYRAAGAVE